MTVVNFRTDAASDHALSELTSDGTTASEAIRRALVDAARQRKRQQMRRESLEMTADPADRALSQQILAQMDALRAW